MRAFISFQNISKFLLNMFTFMIFYDRNILELNEISSDLLRFATASFQLPSLHFEQFKGLIWFILSYLSWQASHKFMNLKTF